MKPLKTLLQGDGSRPLSVEWTKTLTYYGRFIIITILILLVVLGVYRLFFSRPTNSATIQKVEKGGTVNIVQKASSRWFTLFVEPFVGVRTDTEGEGRAELGGRIGCRFEF
jgi:hypothetical protein